MKKSVLSALGLLAALTSQSVFAAEVTLLNVSYDPTRELYQDYNRIFHNTGNSNMAIPLM